MPDASQDSIQKAGRRLYNLYKNPNVKIATKWKSVGHRIVVLRLMARQKSQWRKRWIKEALQIRSWLIQKNITEKTYVVYQYSYA
jgi:hypothetical protein